MENLNYMEAAMNQYFGMIGNKYSIVYLCLLNTTF